MADSTSNGHNQVASEPKVQASTTDVPGIADDWLFPEKDSEQYLRQLDPVEWKEHDMYAILGLAHLRFQASESEIKKAYRRMVLQHHPDKRQQAGTASDDDKYFPCILKAWDILSDPTKRRAYDSIDPIVAEEFDRVPDEDEIQESQQAFFTIMGELFRKNARWSERLPVPKLGDNSSSEAHVANFYDFWYDFQTWREFSYLDEEEKDKGSDRYERREIDKRNKEMRKERKKDETTRIRSLVDIANANDPRIKQFRQEARQRKEDEKAQKQAQRTEKRRQEEESVAAERHARDEQVRQQAEQRKQLVDQQRRERDAAKKALKAEQKLFEQLIKENMQFFNSSGMARVRLLEDLDLLCNVLDTGELKTLREALNVDKSTSAAQELFDAKVKSIRDILRQQNQQTGEYSMPSGQFGAASSKAAGDSAAADIGSKQWHADDVKLLIRALRTFPAGTKNRWDVVQCFVEQHSKTGVKYTAKDVVRRVKDMDRLKTTAEDLQQKAAEALTLKNNDNEGNRAFAAFQHETKHSLAAAHEGSAAVPSERYDRPEHFIKPAKAVPWTAGEQRLLEQALKMYPSALQDRWDLVAETVSTRTKEECLKRYQAIVSAMLAKKAADAKVSN